MPYIPPFRTRRGPQIEPHFGDPDEAGHEPEPSWSPSPPVQADPASPAGRQTEAQRQPPREPTFRDPASRDPASRGSASRGSLESPAPFAAAPLDTDDETIPVLTRLIEPVAQTPVEAPRSSRADEALVARITDEVLDALQPALQTLVSDAVRRALANHAVPGDDT